MPGACPACATPGPGDYVVSGELQLVRCRACGLVYSDPMPREEVHRRYVEDYDLGQHFQTWSDRKRILFRRRLAELPEPVPGRDRLCDVGCADGQFLELAAERGWRAEGVELNPPAAAAARERGFNVHQGALEESEELNWGEFEIVTAWDVLEHTPDPRPFADSLARLAAPRGAVVLTTLNRRSFVARAFGARWSMIGEDHFTYWDEPSLRRLLSAAGIPAERVTSFGVGRDFFKWLDSIQTRLRARRSAGSNESVKSIHYTGQSGGRSWDTSGPILALESAANAGLGALGAGLELYAVARRP